MAPTPFDDAAERVVAGADATIEARALVDRMTLDEKLGCLDGDTPFWPGLFDMMAGGYSQHTWPAAAVERLGIPGLDFADGPRGCVIGPSTAFPVTMARGASFDPDLEREIGRAIGAELRARGATFTGAVCMNVLRHPAWGRAQETYGEDPFHVGEMAAAFTEGLQEHVMACMKHFALNSMENSRFKVDVTVDERALHEVYLRHFERVARAGVAGVMSAYNAVNGEWCGQHHELLVEILRDEWAWDGLVITDFINGLRDPVASVQAGCNIEMPFRQQRALALHDAVADGRLDVADVDQRVVETVATFLRFARVFTATSDPAAVAGPEHRALARRACIESAVLVHNDGVLPIAPDAVDVVAVLGRLADTPNLGDHGSSDVHQPEVVTPLAGLRAALPHADVRHAIDDVSIAVDADLVVVVVGYDKDDEGEFIGGNDAPDASLLALLPPMDHPEVGIPDGYERPPRRSGPTESTGFGRGGDRTSLELRPDDVRLIEDVVAVSDRVVVAVEGGSAVVMPWLEQTNATLLVWYPGMEGGHAIADLVCGADPGGRLPFAVPRNHGDLVDFDHDATAVDYGLLHGQWWLDATGTPAHLPFGHGLSYTSFELGPAVLDDHGAVRVSVSNTGARAGTTVLQVYGSVPDSRHQRPKRRLVGFAKVAVPAATTATVTVPVDLTHLDLRIAGAWVTEDRSIELSIGLDAASARPLPQ